MPYRVLVVDDSTFFRRRVTDILNQSPDLEVIDQARNGQEAVDKVKALKPDVVTMDIEMPVMDGITAVKRIMSTDPVPILMFSSLTHEGAEATLNALDAGALDFLPKKFEDIARDRKEAVQSLQNKVTAIARRKGSLRRVSSFSSPTPGTTKPTQTFIRSSSLSRPEPVEAPSRYKASGKRYKLLAIGTSTGGPVALQTILTKLPANFPYPIVLVQHMPGTFTAAFADRLNNLCKIKVKEGENGESLKAGTAYLAPGGRQMLVDGSAAGARLKIVDVDDSQIMYKPSVDLTFSSVARTFSGDVLGVILTGMGADGREGCKALKGRGARIWAQDEKSCVVYGMPQAVASAGISELSLPLNDVAQHILQEMKG